jgi:16S rRNA G966 N2-methylase RsmD
MTNNQDFLFQILYALIGLICLLNLKQIYRWFLKQFVYLRFFINDLKRDRSIGINTVRKYSKDLLPGNKRYEPTRYEILDHIFEYLRENHPQRRKMVDLGSGRGRVLIYSALNGMEITGVEIDPYLVTEAQKNLKKAVKKHPLVNFKVDMVEQNVVDYELPEDLEILFLFNPFDEHILMTLIRQIQVKKLENLLLVYVTSVYDFILTSNGFKQLKQFSYPHTGYETKIFIN